MNKYIFEELKKCKVAKLPPYDSTTKHMTIPKADNINQLLDIGKCYLIQLEPYILNPPEGFSLHENWNKNIKPPQEFLKVEISQVMGKMIKVNALGYDYKNSRDTDELWEGWLPRKSISILQEL